MLGTIKKVLYPTVCNYFSHATLADGILKGVGQSFRCLFVDNTRYCEYFSSTVYATSPHTSINRRIWIPKLKELIRDPEHSIDLCVAVLPNRYESAFKGLNDFKGHKRVRQIVDASGTWEDVIGRFRNSIKRFTKGMEKSGLSRHISTDMKDFDFFYKRMYLPHTLKQFGSFSIILSYEEMKQYFIKGFLMFVTSGGASIAATLGQIEGQTLIDRKAGVLDGDDSYTKAGALRALYYYMLKFAKENNLLQLDMMASSALLNDGAYRHKRAWGASVYPDSSDSVTTVYYFIPKHSEKVVRFFEQNPVIVHTEQGLKGVAGLNEEFSPKIKKNLFDQFYAPGLEGMILLTPHSKGPLEISWKD